MARWPYDAQTRRRRAGCGEIGRRIRLHLESSDHGEGPDHVDADARTAHRPFRAPRIRHVRPLGPLLPIGEGRVDPAPGKIPQDEYEKLVDTFTAEDFDARASPGLAKEAGMRYITITARHHDGFSLYDTRGLSEFDAPHSPAKRDLIAEFVEGCRAEGIVPFFYHTTLDWRWKTQEIDEAKFEEYLDYLHASVELLCTQYGPIGGLWFDGNWSARDRLERRPSIRHHPQAPARGDDHQQHGA